MRCHRPERERRQPSEGQIETFRLPRCPRLPESRGRGAEKNARFPNHPTPPEPNLPSATRFGQGCAKSQMPRASPCRFPEPHFLRARRRNTERCSALGTENLARQSRQRQEDHRCPVDRQRRQCPQRDLVRGRSASELRRARRAPRQAAWFIPRGARAAPAFQLTPNDRASPTGPVRAPARLRPSPPQSRLPSSRPVRPGDRRCSRRGAGGR